MYNVVLWGMGKGYDLFTACKGHDMVNIIAMADSYVSEYSKIDGIPIIRPEDICSQDYDYLIITTLVDKVFNEILERALDLGVKREAIIPVRVFEIPFFNFNDYIKIKEANISFVSDFCFAGFLYYRFGFKRTSPTINMHASSNEGYLNFLKDIKGHLALEMEKIENIVDQPYMGLYTYPRGRLGDCEWVFDHDTTFESAVERWNKGRERFNYDNYVAFMTIRSDEAAYAFEALPIEHKLGFYWKELNLKSVVCIPEWSNPEVRRRYVNNFAWIVNHIADGSGRAGTPYRCQMINWMKFLQFKDGFIRKI